MNFAIAFLLIVCSHALTVSSHAQTDQKAQNKAIESIRKGTLLIKGEPGTEVKIEQLKHEFWFGCAISSHVFFENSRLAESDISIYKEKFLENFNAAVTENAVKWGSMERKRGQIDYQTADHMPSTLREGLQNTT